MTATAKRRIVVGSALVLVILAGAAMANARRGSMSYHDTRWMAWERFQVITTTTEDGWRQLTINVR